MTNIDKTMNENDEVVVDPLNPEKTENKEPDLEVEIELEDTDDVESLKKKLTTANAQKNHWRKKATTPEEIKKEVAKPEVKQEVKADSLSQTDLIALMKADIAEEDIQEIVDYAKLKGITVSAALKSSVVKTILTEKSEERKTANASNTSKAKGSASKLSDDALLENARKGVMPTTDEEMERLIKVRKGIKR